MTHPYLRHDSFIYYQRMVADNASGALLLWMHMSHVANDLSFDSYTNWFIPAHGSGQRERRAAALPPRDAALQAERANCQQQQHHTVHASALRSSATRTRRHAAAGVWKSSRPSFEALIMYIGLFFFSYAYKPLATEAADILRPSAPLRQRMRVHTRTATFRKHCRRCERK